jgi:hypothetical protein
MANTTGFEIIGKNTYLVTRDASGNILDMIGPPPPPELMVISKWNYRNLFTMAERIGIDGFQSNATLTAAQKAQLATLYEDFAAARHIDLTHPAVISATNLLEQLGLIASGRAAQILGNKPPPA